MNKKPDKKMVMKKLAIYAVAAILLIVVVFTLKIGLDSKGSGDKETAASMIKDSDIVIQVKDVSEKPAFYPAEINGTNMEVIAVKASDKTIRTAFNTCQVCYNSGKGYYKVEGNQLVCQNCGNRFGMDDVEVSKGGCNPVPITDKYKKVNDKTITITRDVLTEAASIFENWK